MGSRSARQDFELPVAAGQGAAGSAPGTRNAIRGDALPHLVFVVARCERRDHLLSPLAVVIEEKARLKSGLQKLNETRKSLSGGEKVVHLETGPLPAVCPALAPSVASGLTSDEDPPEVNP